MSPGQRLLRARDLVDAIHACDPDDAEHIMSVILEEWRSGAPPTSFLDAKSDAAFWARTASFDDLRAVSLAAGPSWPVTGSDRAAESGWSGD